MNAIEKVTVFITCTHVARQFLLLFRHPFAGIQLPAGTVEIGEAPEAAARREAAEETGITALGEGTFLGQEDGDLPDGLCALTAETTVYARPDPTSFDRVRIRRGIVVTPLRQHGDYTQIHYEEMDNLDDPQYISFGITGWAATRNLARRRIRSFYHFPCTGDPQATWDIHTDNHTFHLFWAAVDNLPALVPPQQPWLTWFPH